MTVAGQACCSNQLRARGTDHPATTRAMIVCSLHLSAQCRRTLRSCVPTGFLCLKTTHLAYSPGCHFDVVSHRGTRSFRAPGANCIDDDIVLAACERHRSIDVLSVLAGCPKQVRDCVGTIEKITLLPASTTARWRAMSSSHGGRRSRDACSNSDHRCSIARSCSGVARSAARAVPRPPPAPESRRGHRRTASQRCRERRLVKDLPTVHLLHRGPPTWSDVEDAT